MSRRVLLSSLLGLLLSVCAAPSAHAGWMWSPTTGWIGPSGAVKDSPEEQLAFTVALFDRGEFKRTKVECKKLLKAYPNSREAAEASYYLGRAEEGLGDYYAAYKAYRKTIQTYPSTGRFQEILEREFEIAGKFLAGQKRKVFGRATLLPARDKAVEIYQAVAEDGPFSEFGELAQYNLGLAHLAIGEYEQAVTAFEGLIDRYPKSPLVDDARFQLAQASLKGSFKPGYDPQPTDTALEELDAFVDAYPSSNLTPQAIERVTALRERRAQHEYEIARFYEGRQKFQSALVYYQGLVAEYPQTAWAPRAAMRAQVLERVLSPAL